MFESRWKSDIAAVEICGDSGGNGNDHGGGGQALYFADKGCEGKPLRLPQG